MQHDSRVSDLGNEVDKKMKLWLRLNNSLSPPLAGLRAALSDQSAPEGDDLFLKVSLRDCVAINKAI